eukprot:364307-Chlamydomonas_euryale.AAC.4
MVEPRSGLLKHSGSMHAAVGQTITRTLMSMPMLLPMPMHVRMPMPMPMPMHTLMPMPMHTLMPMTMHVLMTNVIDIKLRMVLLLMTCLPAIHMHMHTCMHTPMLNKPRNQYTNKFIPMHKDGQLCTIPYHVAHARAHPQADAHVHGNAWTTHGPCIHACVAIGSCMDIHRQPHA